MSEQEPQQIQPNNNRIVRERTTVMFSGPLPSPEIIESYERILPGAAERIFKMAEEQSRHRREIESGVIRSDIRNSHLGLIFGFIIGLAFLSSSVLMVYFGQAVVGSVLGLGTIIGLVGVFVYGSQLRRKEREWRREQQVQR